MRFCAFHKREEKGAFEAHRQLLQLRDAAMSFVQAHAVHHSFDFRRWDAESTRVANLLEGTIEAIEVIEEAPCACCGLLKLHPGQHRYAIMALHVAHVQSGLWLTLTVDERLEQEANSLVKKLEPLLNSTQ